MEKLDLESNFQIVFVDGYEICTKETAINGKTLNTKIGTLFFDIINHKDFITTTLSFYKDMFLNIDIDIINKDSFLEKYLEILNDLVNTLYKNKIPVIFCNLLYKALYQGIVHALEILNMFKDIQIQKELLETQDEEQINKFILDSIDKNNLQAIKEYNSFVSLSIYDKLKILQNNVDFFNSQNISKDYGKVFLHEFLEQEFTLFDQSIITGVLITQNICLKSKLSKSSNTITPSNHDKPVLNKPLLAYALTRKIPKSTIQFVNIKNEKIKNLKLSEIYQTSNYLIATNYHIEQFDEFLSIYFKYFIDNKVTINECKNCGKYFIPHNKQVYCDNPSPQNPEKTCRLLSDDMRNNKNIIYEIYRQNYKTQSNKMRRNIKNGNIKEDDLRKRFGKWNKTARKKMEQCKAGNITMEEFTEFFKKSQNWIKKYK